MVDPLVGTTMDMDKPVMIINHCNKPLWTSHIDKLNSEPINHYGFGCINWLYDYNRFEPL